MVQPFKPGWVNAAVFGLPTNTLVDGGDDLLASIVMLCGVSALLARKPATPETIVLLKRTASWNDVPYAAYPQGQPELTTVRITIPAHSSLPWNTHDMPNAAYLLSGHLTVQSRIPAKW